jgi:ethanolamine utilization protein EutA (predicted chaperonin)
MERRVHGDVEHDHADDHGDVEHDHGDDHGHAPTEAERRAFAQAVLERENLELLTVGIDVGSATSHLLFARVLFQRRGHRLADRFVVVRRDIVWRSPILLTPFLPDGTIDAGALSSFVRGCYRQAGLAPEDVDAGAVILTGEAIKRRNARAISEALAGDSGRFVCASAGHHLESVLAAHGSGATALSAARNACGLHVDIGGGTTKLALIDSGEILGVAALAVGGRLIARDAAGQWSRVDESARLAAADLGTSTASSALAGAGTRQRIARRLATLVVDQIDGGPADDLGRALELTEPLPRTAKPSYLTFSGGVAEYLLGHQDGEYGDIAPDLAAAIADELRTRIAIPVVDPGQRIRATVIGASQFSVQASGRTIYMSGRAALPLRNIPVVHIRQPLPGQVDSGALIAEFRRSAQRQDIDTSGPVALSFCWAGQLTYQRLSGVARAIAAVAGPCADPAAPLVIAVDADIAQSLGAMLSGELGVRRDLIALDGIELSELDYIDVGEYLDPPGVLPVVIKSLLFA